MNLPNKLTISRIFLTFIFLYLLFRQSIGGKAAALVIFIFAAASDLFDGWIAKRRNMVTDFGKIMDPIADKILVLGAFIAFVKLDLIDVWMVVVIIVRELIITHLRLYALTQKKVMAAERAGKHKTVSQMVAIFTILCYLLFKEILVGFGIWGAGWERSFSVGIYLLMLATVVLTLISGLSYFWRNRKLIVSK